MNQKKNKIGPEWDNIPFENNHPANIFELVHSRLDRRSRNGVNLLVGGVSLLSLGIGLHLVDSVVLNDFVNLKTQCNVLEGVGIGTSVLGGLMLGLSPTHPEK